MNLSIILPQFLTGMKLHFNTTNICQLRTYIIFLTFIATNLLFADLPTDSLLSPEHISYQGILGYDEKIPGLLEWADISKQTQEPEIRASIHPLPGLRIRWLGTFGFEIGDNETTILIDPFVSRPTPLELLHPLEIDTPAVNYYVLNPLRNEHLSVILITHSHYDHLEDVPYILSRFPNPDQRPLIVGDPNMDIIIKKYQAGSGIRWSDRIGGLGNTHTLILDFLSKEQFTFVGQFGNFKITAFKSLHPKYDFIPWRGPNGTPTGFPPYLANQYPLYHNISIGYLIEYLNLKIYFSDSPILLHPEKIGHVDILIQGIAARKVENNISEALVSLNPTYYIPAHFDNFFKHLIDFKQFDPVIGIRLEKPKLGIEPTYFIDFSRFEEFLQNFDRLYLSKANNQLGANSSIISPKLRLMKMFYYYSLNPLLEKSKK